MFCSHQAMTRGEGSTVYNAALLLGPSSSVWIGDTSVFNGFCIWASLRKLPAVTKFTDIFNNGLTSGNEVIGGVTIVITTETTGFALLLKKINIISLVSLHKPCNNHISIENILIVQKNFIYTVTNKKRCTSNFGSSLMNSVDFLSHIKTKPMLASTTK